MTAGQIKPGQLCQECGATETACASSRTHSGRECCTGCNHVTTSTTDLEEPPLERTTHMTDLQEAKALIATRADAAALMIAAVDDRPGLDALLKTLLVKDLPALLLAAIEVGGTMVRFGDEQPRITARETLDCLQKAFREIAEEDPE